MADDRRRHPAPDASWTEIEDFALTFELGEGRGELAAMAGRVRRQWTRFGQLPADISELRACLFFEQRRWHYLGGEPEGRAREYALALVRAIAEHPEGSGAERGGDGLLFQAG